MAFYSNPPPPPDNKTQSLHFPPASTLAGRKRKHFGGERWAGLKKFF